MQTPLQSARSWAAQHPTETAVLLVTGICHAGKGGHRIKQATYQFFVQAGRVAAATRTGFLRRDGLNDQPRNGICAVCKEVHLTPTLKLWMAPDPDAGQAVWRIRNGQSVPYTISIGWDRSQSVVYDDLCWALACDMCGGTNNWRTANRYGQNGDFEVSPNRCLNWRRYHPLYHTADGAVQHDWQIFEINNA